MTSTPAIPSSADRQVNLFVALRLSPQGLTRAEIFQEVHGYEPEGTPATVRRFERDKDELRRLGVPLWVEGSGPGARYHIRARDYELEDVSLTASQAAVVALAASAWGEGDLPDQARSALTKLLAVAPAARISDAEASLPLASPAAVAGVGEESLQSGDGGSVTPALGQGLRLNLAGSEVPAALATAVAQRQVVSFDYTSASSGKRRARRVEPYRLTISEGAWYVVGRDCTAHEIRTFRLARISGEITILSEPGAFVPHEETGDSVTVRLAVLPGRAMALRARARRGQARAGHAAQASHPHEVSARSEVSSGVGHDAGEGAEGAPQHLPSGRDLVELTVGRGELMALAGQIAGLAGAAVVLEPASLAQAVTEHWEGVAALGGAES